MRCLPNASHSPRVSARIVAFTSLSGIGLPVIVSMTGLVTQAARRSATPASRCRACNEASLVALVLEGEQEVFQAAVPPCRQLRKAARPGLGDDAVDQLLLERLSELGLAQLFPIGLDRGLQVVEEIGHATDPAREVEGERRAHEGPANAR